MDIKEYEEFCKNSKYGNFMQSADWAKVKKGWSPEYVAVRDENGKINGCTLVLVKKIPILNTAMLYAPRALYATLTTVKPSEKYLSR
jgi:peptidoglycan pentaglycine glycine transferase (the first glycine)